MSNVNVNRENPDPFYRYKMPLIQTKVEGRGNGLKTVIPNMVDVAKSLDRPPSYPTKYFGIELGSQTVMKDSEDLYIVSGQFDSNRFQELLDDFIKKFVLCPQCTNPETVLRITSKKEIEQKCKACGYIGFLPLVHRLTTFMINNPPDGGSSSKKKGKSKEERRAEKNKKNGKIDKKSSVSSDGGDAANEKDSTTSSLGQIGAQVDSAKQRLGGIVDAPAAVVGTEDVEWSVDLSEEAVRKRTEALGTGVTSLTQTDDLDLSTDDRLGLFEKYVQARLSLPKFPAKEVVGEAERLDVKDKAVMIVMQYILGDADFLPTLAKNQGLLQRFCIESPKAQKYLLGALEKIIFARKDELLPKAAKIIKQFYDLDILDEDEIIAWNDKVSKKYVPKDFAESLRKKIKPVVEWLKEADEESDEESDEEDIFVQDPEAVLAAEKEAKEKAEKEEKVEEDTDSSVASPTAEEEAEDEENEDDIDMDDLDDL